MAISHRAIHRLEMFFNQVHQWLGFEFELHDFAHDFEKLAKLFQRWVFDFDLVRNPSQECIVDQILGFEVG